MSADPLVYVVDDDVASLMSIQALMSVGGYNVNTFSSAEDFLAEYDGREHGCLILDVRLEGMNGLELQKKLRVCGATLPIIMISGHADAIVHAEAKTNGALAVLEKPFSGSELRDWVRHALGQDELCR